MLRNRSVATFVLPDSAWPGHGVFVCLMVAICDIGFWAATTSISVYLHCTLTVVNVHAEYQKPPRSKSQKGVTLDDVKELQVRVKLDHPVLEQDHWSRLYTDMKKAEACRASTSYGQLPSEIGLDQSRMLVIQAAVLCTAFMLHTSDLHLVQTINYNPLYFPRHDCEKDMCIDIRSLAQIILASVAEVS